MRPDPKGDPAMTHSLFVRAAALVGAGLLVIALPTAAEPRTTSDLLLPYFEVDLGGPRTTLFAVGNAHDEAVQVRVSVDTNWGIPVIGVTFGLDPGEVVTVNLRDWIERGELPTRNLGPAELDHVQAAFSGQPSPKDGMYYGEEVEPGLAVGFVTFRILSQGRPKVLWGDYFWVDPAGNFAEGELLVDIARLSTCRGLCDHHLVRFLEGGAFDGGTDFIVWTGRTVPVPRRRPSPSTRQASISGEAFYEESGVRFDERVLDLLPTQAIPLAHPRTRGSVRLDRPGDPRSGLRRGPLRGGGPLRRGDPVLVRRGAPPPPPIRRRPSIDIEKLTAGADADSPPGPALEIGTSVVWEYVVTNTGNVALTGIVVSDNRGVVVSCPRTTLGPRADHVYWKRHRGQRPVRQHRHGHRQPAGGGRSPTPIPSHYLGVPFIVTEPAIALEKLTNGQDADLPPGAP
jgi:hypothetical protein